MSKTRSDLILATLKLLNIVGAGQNPAPEDVDEIESLIDGKLDYLEYRDIVTLPDRHEFEDVYIEPLSIILANQAAPTFSQPRNPDSNLMAEQMLRQIKPNTWVGGPQDVEWY